MRTIPSVPRVPRVLAVLLGLIVAPCYADLFDDFEDGDYTSNPAWTVVEAGGSAAIVPDPLTPPNLVLEGVGGTLNPHRLRTPVDMPVLWFDLSFDLLVLDGPFDFAFLLEGLAPDSDALEFRLHGAGGPGVSLDFSYQGHYFAASISLEFGGDWHTVHIWQGPDDYSVSFEVSGALSGVFSGVDLSTAPDRASVSIAFQEVNPQYVDNIHVMNIPEPSAAILLIVAGVIVLRR
jgi:hypothetical protein